MSPLLVMAAVLSFQGPSPPRSALSVAEVLDRWEAGVRMIDSYDIHTETLSTSFNYLKDGVAKILSEEDAGPPFRYYSHIYRSGEKRRGEFGGDGDGHFRTTLIWSGQGWYTFSQIQKNEVVINSTINVFGAMEYEDYDAIYRTMFGDGDRIAVSRSRPARLAPREGRLYVIDVPEMPGGDWSNIRWRFWLDPDRNFMPVRWTQWFVNSGIEMHDRDYDIGLKEVNPGVWAPINATIRVYHKDHSSANFGKRIGLIKLSVIEEKARFNVPIPDDLFAVNIPTGATVVDHVRNAVYKQGGANPDAYLTHLAEEGRKGLERTPVADRRPPELVFIPDPPRPWLSWRAAALTLGIAALAFGASTMARRFFRRAT